MILESDASWKEVMERKIRVLEAATTRLASHFDMPDLLDDAMDDDDDADAVDMAITEHRATADRPMPSPSAPPPALPPPSPLQPPLRRPVQNASSPNPEKHTPHNFEIVMDPESGPATMPGSVVSPIVAIPGLEQNRAEQDIITRGTVTVVQAQAYLDIYQNRLDHFLYRIIGDRKTLSEVRADSPLLLAAICAVGALHLATTDFEKCYQDFVTIAAAQTFSRQNNVDDIRGLCIGAFWLSGISWTCIGQAVRLALELQLHRSIYKALQGERNHYLRTRLYYLVFVCDHHFSV